jgi:hypothetical protein
MCDQLGFTDAAELGSKLGVWGATEQTTVPAHESSSNLGVRRLSLEPGTAGTIVERVLPIRCSTPWSWSATVGARLAASSASTSS